VVGRDEGFQELFGVAPLARNCLTTINNTMEGTSYLASAREGRRGVPFPLAVISGDIRVLVGGWAGGGTFSHRLDRGVHGFAVSRCSGSSCRRDTRGCARPEKGLMLVSSRQQAPRAAIRGTPGCEEKKPSLQGARWLRNENAALPGSSDSSRYRVREKAIEIRVNLRAVGVA